MENNEKYRHTCCFTGHRPERLEMPQKKVIQWLYEKINEAVEDGYTNFISGMQRGVDIWAAEIVIKLQKEGTPVKLIAACAFPGMENEWDQSWKNRYYKLLRESEEINYIGDEPGRKSFFARDEWMVDHSNRVIGVFTGAPGGTQKTINYAKEKRREVVLIEKEK